MRYNCTAAPTNAAISKTGERLPLFEIARVFVRLDHVAGHVVNADDRASADIRHVLVSVFRFRLILAADLSPVAVAPREGVCSSASVESTLEGSPR